MLAACRVELALKGQDAPSCPVSALDLDMGVVFTPTTSSILNATWGARQQLVLDAAFALLLPVPVPVWPLTSWLVI